MEDLNLEHHLMISDFDKKIFDLFGFITQIYIQRFLRSFRGTGTDRHRTGKEPNIKISILLNFGHFFLKLSHCAMGKRDQSIGRFVDFIVV
jgi:hypothetical protein